MERVVKIGLLSWRPRSGCKGLVHNFNSSCFSWTSSCGMKLRSSRENGFFQEEGNVQTEGTTNSLLPSDMILTQPFIHQTSKLQRRSSMETCNKISAEDENIQHFNVSTNGKVEVRRKGKEIMSSHGILSSKNPQRKYQVHNGCISPISIDVDATILEKTVKTIPEVGDNMNVNVTDNAYTGRKGLVNEVLNLDWNNSPHVSQQEDRRKGKEIIYGHIIECKDKDAPLRQSRKRMRLNPLSCEEGDK
jgi:ribosome-associated protein YbcJ (S4-like RNA binding protein)